MDKSLSTSTQAIAVTALLAMSTYLFAKLYYIRFKQNAHIPQLPPSFFWGHLITFYEFTKRGIPDRHPG